MSASSTAPTAPTAPEAPAQALPQYEAIEVHRNCPHQLRELVKATLKHLDPAYFARPEAGEVFDDHRHTLQRLNV
jgi:hypothetical protein